MSKIDEIRKIYHDTKKKAYGKNISISLTDSQIKTLLDMLDEAKDALEFVVNNSGTSTDYNLRALQVLREKLK